MVQKRTLSPEQIRASDPTQNVWVSANAGTGKTSVLVSRLLRILFRSADTAAGTGILCLTYTNAAAGEMRNRILASLREWAHADDNELAELLTDIADNKHPTDKDIAHARAIFYEYIDNPQMLKIRTIHGFCEEILHRFPIEAGIPPTWLIVSGAEQTRMRHDAFEKLIGTNQNALVDNAFSRVLSQTSEYSFDDLLGVLAGQYRQFFVLDDNFNNRKQFIDNIEKYLCINTRAYDAFNSPMAKQNRLHILSSIADEKKRRKYMEKIEFAIKNNLPFDEYKDAFLTQNGTKRSDVSKKDYLIAEQDLVFDLYNENNNHDIYENTIALYDLAAAYAETYREMKRARGVLDFDDLLLYTEKLFSDPAQMGWVLSQMDVQLHHILVDEAQDTSALQWEILDALSADFTTEGEGANPSAIFVVGDPKQSIYGFQGADPDAFIAAKNAINAQIKNDKRRVLDVSLDQSYRSSAAVLRAVDDFFNDDAVVALTNFPHATHKCFRTDAMGIVELHPLIETDDDNNTDAARKIYINAIADKIAILVKNGTPAADIMVLVQRRNPFAPRLIDALQRRDIAVAGSDRITLPDFPAIRDLLNVIRFVIDNKNDYALACILHSPLFGLSYDELYNAAHNRGKDVDLFSRVNILFPDVYKRLQDILAIKDVGPYTFFMNILDTNNARENMIASMGTQIIDPLEEFLTICLSYERTRPGTLADFAEWFITGDTEIVRETDTAAGVRIVTAHGAKGLEAPVVFLIDTIRTPHSRNSGHIPEPVPIGRDLFLWRGLAEKTPEFVEAETIEYNKKLAEYYRLLYVTMTRARDELYIYGFRGGNESAANDAWHTMLTAVLSKYGTIDNDNIIRIS